MTPIPTGILTPSDPPQDLIGWRLTTSARKKQWDSGYGSSEFGGRWNPKGLGVVYASLDPSTAIVEIAVHTTFATLYRVPHTMTSFRVKDPSTVRVVHPGELDGHDDWLKPGGLIVAQQKFGASLFVHHAFVLIPSVVSANSWNLLFHAQKAKGGYEIVSQEDFTLDRRLTRG